MQRPRAGELPQDPRAEQRRSRDAAPRKRPAAGQRRGQRAAWPRWRAAGALRSQYSEPGAAGARCGAERASPSLGPVELTQHSAHLRVLERQLGPWPPARWLRTPQQPARSRREQRPKLPIPRAAVPLAAEPGREPAAWARGALPLPCAAGLPSAHRRASKRGTSQSSAVRRSPPCALRRHCGCHAENGRAHAAPRRPQASWSGSSLPSPQPREAHPESLCS